MQGRGLNLGHLRAHTEMCRFASAQQHFMPLGLLVVVFMTQQPCSNAFKTGPLGAQPEAGVDVVLHLAELTDWELGCLPSSLKLPS